MFYIAYTPNNRSQCLICELIYSCIKEINVFLFLINKLLNLPLSSHIEIIDKTIESSPVYYYTNY